MTFEHFRDLSDRRFESLQSGFGLAGEAYLDEELHRIAEPACIEHGPIAVDEPHPLEIFHPAVACRCGKTDRLAQLLRALVAMLLQQSQQASIDRINLQCHCAI